MRPPSPAGPRRSRTRHLRPGRLAQAFANPVKGGQDPGHQGEPGPGPQRTLDTVRRLRTQIVVAQPCASSKGIRQALNDVRRRHAALKGASRKPHAAILVGKDGGALVGQLETVTVGGLQQSCRSLAAQPFQEPALPQPRTIGESTGRDRALPDHGPVQAQQIAKMNHQRHHFTLLVAPHPEGEGGHSIRVHLPLRRGEARRVTGVETGSARHRCPGGRAKRRSGSPRYRR